MGKGKGEGAEVGNGNTARDPSPVVQVSGGISVVMERLSAL